MNEEFKPIQFLLVGQYFQDSTLVENIRFNKAVVDGPNGKLYDLRQNEDFDYFLKKGFGHVTIECSYFGNDIYKLQTTPTGFNLLEPTDDALIKTYINSFCIKNQNVINEILQLLVSKGEDGMSNTCERIAKSVGEAFDNSQTLKERCDIVYRIMDILIASGSVSEGEILGERSIAYTKRTQTHLQKENFVWLPNK